MAYTLNDQRPGLPSLTSVETVKQCEIGTIAKGVDEVYGEGEFIYLPGVASTVRGSAVLYDSRPGAATTALLATGNRGQVAIAMGATVAGTFGWYQISGASVSRSSAAVANALVYASATGILDDAVSATNKIDGAVYKTADGTPSAGLAVVQLSRPSMAGNG